MRITAGIRAEGEFPNAAIPEVRVIWGVSVGAVVGGGGGVSRRSSKFHAVHKQANVPAGKDKTPAPAIDLTKLKIS